MARLKRLHAIGVLLLAALAAVLFGLCLGEVTLSPVRLLALLSGSEADALARTLVIELRLPRIASGFACGALLALAGALMQLLLRNPLADPYVLGISGGASLGALSAILLGLMAVWVELAAFVGALLVMLTVFALAHGDGSWTRTRLLLTGVVLASGCGAGISLLLVLSPDRQLPGMLFWLMGDLGLARHPQFALLAALTCLLACLPFARDFNLLAQGEATAQALGVPARRLRWLVYMLASLATAVAVSVAGAVGFVGLLVPHAVRMLIGNDQRILLPACMLAGGSLLIVADTLARTVVAPLQLPVGVLTALIGVPAFLWLLSRHLPEGRS